MSSADRRKELKARKERQQLKKKAQLHDRRHEQQEIAVLRVVTTITGLVSSGQARIAMGSFPSNRHLMAAMWSGSGIQPQVYHVKDGNGLARLSQAAIQHVSLDEWEAFMAEHKEAIRSAADGDLPISIIQWRPGEEPKRHLAQD